MELGYPAGYVSVAFKGTGSENVPGPPTQRRQRKRWARTHAHRGMRAKGRAGSRRPCIRTEALL